MSVSNPTGRRRPITRLAAMLGRTRIALLAGVLTIAIAGCGGNNGTIPKSDSQNLLNLLTSLEDQVKTNQCTLAEGTAMKIDEAIKNLPDTVDPKVQEALDKGAANLAALTNDPSQCVDGASGAEGVQPTDTTTDSSSSTTSTTSTTTTTTESTSTAQQDTTQQPPTGTPPGHETPPGNGGGQGGGGGTGGPTGGLEPPNGGKR